LRKAKEKFSVGDYKGALDKYELAKKCPNASSCSASIAAGIAACRKKISGVTPQILVDADGDGYSDKVDKCPKVYSRCCDGCPKPTQPIVTDVDGDGYSDKVDKCPSTYSSCCDGCPAAADEDGDGYSDEIDKCPSTYSSCCDGCPPPPVRSGSYTERVNGVSFEMVEVEGGTFQMGSSSSGETNEVPIHSVTLSSFSIGKTEVTQGQWQAVMGNNPSGFKGDTRPVEQVSWEDCQEFVVKLNRLTDKQYRLPTEAEWEYASRGGNKSRGYTYSGSDTLDEVGWNWDNSGSEPHAVGQKRANELGLYDMTGNVWEWCNDWYGSDYYGQSPSSNPQGPSSGSHRVTRGGSWNNLAQYCRSAIRNFNSPSHRFNDLGFRLVSQ
jgi:formylglycine-generating enzyme required for sulfatase activity